MKFTSTTMKTALGAAGIAAVTLLAPATASAAPAVQGFGVSQNLVDGPMVTAYTVSNLQPSTVTIPGYTPQGTLYQADVIARSEGGTVTPMIKDFSARGPNGQTYKVVTKAGAPNGLNPAPIAQGTESTGTLYFDVTGGGQPNGVVYNDGMQDILIWTSNMTGTSPTAPNAIPGQPPSPATPNVGPASAEPGEQVQSS